MIFGRGQVSVCDVRLWIHCGDRITGCYSSELLTVIYLTLRTEPTIST